MTQKLSAEQIGNGVGILNRTQAHRFYWKASGYIDQDLDKPVVAIANSVQDAGVGHVHQRELARHVRESVYTAGGTPIEFNVIGPCGGYARNKGIEDIFLLYDLPQRDNIADAIEIQMLNYGADALVCIGTCDKIIPGMWLGAARVMGPCFAEGQAAGIAADLAVRNGCRPPEINIANLRSELKKDGARLE